MQGVMVGMDHKDRSYDTSWLPEDLEIDPIMDETADKTLRTSASISTLGGH